MLSGKIAVVTGGSRGIGRAICLKLATQRAAVAFTYAGNEAAARETEAALKELGVQSLAVRADVGNAEAVTAFFRQVTDTFGRIDILINNAGVTRDALSPVMKEADFDRVIETNLKGAFLCCKAAARPMMKQRAGRIVNISSVVALRGNAGQANYCASKAGLIGMTKALAKELGGRGITVNAVAPGFIETDMTSLLPEEAKKAMLEGIPLSRAGKPEDVANAVAFLAGEDAAYITGQVLCVDGGMAM